MVFNGYKYTRWVCGWLLVFWVTVRCRALGSGMRAIITKRCLPGIGFGVDVGYLEIQQVRIHSINPCLSPKVRIVIGSGRSIGLGLSQPFLCCMTIHMHDRTEVKAGVTASPSLVPSSHQAAAMETFLNIIQGWLHMLLPHNSADVVNTLKIPMV